MLQIKTKRAGLVLHHLLLGNTVQMNGKRWKINKRGFLCSFDLDSECFTEENVWFHKFVQYCDDIGPKQWLKILRSLDDIQAENFHVFSQKKAV
jgi:hypothetical protein